MSLMTRKIILWSVTTVLGIGLLFWWFNNSQKNIAGFQINKFIESLNLPEINYGQ